MRVLLVTNQYAPVIGGIEVFLRQLAPALQARGHDVEVLTGAHPDVPGPTHAVDGITVHRTDIVRAVMRKDPIAVARCRSDARRVVAGFRPDVIHAHDCGPNLWAIADGAVPVLATVHTSTDLFAPEQLAPIARQLASSAWITGVSRGVVDELAACAPSLADRMSVVVNGVAVPPTPPAPYPREPRIVAAGRMVAQKGFDVLLRAFAHLAAHDADTELLIVGDGPMRGDLEHLATTLGIADRVHMPGPVRHAQMTATFAAASVVAMPSRFEGMPLVALEAGIAARPVVATPVQGLGDVVVDGATGLLVPPEDAPALAAALGALLDDPGRAARLGEAARRHVIAHHSFAAAVSAYDALYHRIAA